MKNLYFLLRDELHKNGNTGYSRVELHALAKQHILPLLVDEPGCWKDDTVSSSTTSLTDKGWDLFTEQFKIWAHDNFNASMF